MALTKCPHCGHTVLSIAAQCPACSGMLSSTFLGLEHEGELAQCRSCGHPVRSRTAVCPHCGLEHPARHRSAARVAVPAFGAVLGAVVLAIVGRQLAFQPPSAPAQRLTSAFLTSQLAVARPIQAAPPELLKQDRAAAADSLTVADSQVIPAPGVDPSLQTRWVADWSNLRRSPANEGAVVRVLAPGTEVRATPSRWGWWAIVWQGDTVGYMAGALLRASRPAR